jgi:hypothetical protein
MIEQKEAEKLKKFETGGEGKEKNKSFTQRKRRGDAEGAETREKRTGLKTGHYKESA